ncbi:hypothetical protein IWX78_001565 [Mycetocola sp. CAN_C7]|uniref:hypothetical protein n=1 Tax=Mycetocola sp. CAN_C7 TaxID=2787724 RepID=UPI0018C9A4D1
MTPTADTLDVSGGASTSVETDELFLVAATLTTLAADARDWAHRAAMTRCITEWSADAAPFGFAEPDLTRSAAMLQDAAALAESLSSRVETAATAYAAVEQKGADVSGLVAALGGFLTGGLIRNIFIGALPLLPSAAVAALVAQHPEVRRLAAVAGQPLLSALTGNAALLESPAFVSLVRALVSSADDIALGVAGIDPPVARLLGDDGAGIVGLSSMAGALLLLAGRNAYTATPITLSTAESTPVTAPRSLADAASRIPESGPGRPQIRVERFEGGARPSYAVYLAGTSEFSTDGAEPFDMGSNLAGIAGDDAAAYRATLDAMDEAGIRPGDSVTLVGHSQGGLVAARVAASGAYDTDALITFGSPTGQIPIPDSVAHLAVEHAEDLTPALGGAPIEGDDGRDRVVVTRSIHDPAVPERPFGSAHFMAGYADTAALIDGSDDPRLDRVKAALDTLGEAERGGTSTLYRAVKRRG